jgi:hypothetical protein
MKNRLSVLLIAAVIAGCITTPPSPAEASGRDQTRAFAGDCIFRPPDQDTEGALSGVVDAVVGGVFSATLGRIGKALRAAGEEDADVVVGRYPAEVEPGNPAACVFVAKGHWSAASADPFQVDGKTIRFDNYILSDPDFFLEVAVVSSDGGNALRLVPNYFEYRRLIEDRSDDDDQHNRGIAFEVAVHAPGVGPKDKNAVGATLVLGTMTTGYAYNLRDGKRRQIGSSDWGSETNYLPLEYTSAWFKTFAPAAQQATNSKKAAASNAAAETPSPAGSPPAAAAQNETRRQLLPRTVTVTFTETRAPRKFLLFLADVFDASKDEIQEAAELAVLESKQAEAQLAAAQASTTLMTAYLTKLSAAEVAIIGYCSANTDGTSAGRADRIAKSSAANIAQRTANVAALAASEPLPYTSFVPLGSGPIDGDFCPS